MWIRPINFNLIGLFCVGFTVHIQICQCNMLEYGCVDVWAQDYIGDYQP